MFVKETTEWLGELWVVFVEMGLSYRPSTYDGRLFKLNDEWAWDMSCVCVFMKVWCREGVNVICHRINILFEVELSIACAVQWNIYVCSVRKWVNYLSEEDAKTKMNIYISSVFEQCVYVYKGITGDRKWLARLRETMGIGVMCLGIYGFDISIYNRS